MRAAQYYGPKDIRIENVASATVETGQIRVDVHGCGICGSDLHEYLAGPLTIPDEPHPVTGETAPITIGHEIAGTVSEVGAQTDLDVGTPVVINPIIWCGSCQYCDEGNYRLCPNGGFIGLSGWGGGFSENIVVPEVMAIPLSDGVSLDFAPLVEPFTVGIHAVTRSGLNSNGSVAIFGSGPIGLTVLQAAKATGAGPIVVSEPRAARRKLAQESGADIVIDPTETDPIPYITDATDGGVDLAFEVAGVEQSVHQALHSTRSGGTITIVSLFEETIPVDLMELVVTEKNIIGTAAFRGGPLASREFRTTIRFFEEGIFDPIPLITSRIDLPDIVENGFERLIDDESREVKIIVSP